MSRRTRTMAMLLSSAAIAGAPGVAQAHGGGGHGHGERASHKHGGGHHGFRGERRFDRGLARTAEALGVTKDQLKAALKAVKEQQDAAAKPPSLKDLVAQQLGVTSDQLKAAFEQARQQSDSKDEFEQAFAAALGKDVATVEAAYKAAGDQLKAELKARRDAFIQALATQLNLPVEKVDAAFTKSCDFKRH